MTVRSQRTGILNRPSLLLKGPLRIHGRNPVPCRGPGRWSEITSPIDDRQPPVTTQYPASLTQYCRVIVELVPDVGHEDNVAASGRQTRFRAFALHWLNDILATALGQFSPNMGEHVALKVNCEDPAPLPDNRCERKGEVASPRADISDGRPGH